MLEKLSEARTLWLTFALSVVLTLSFAVVMQLWAFQLIDRLSDPDEIGRHINAMTGEQKRVHIWVTATMDVVYPLAYTALSAGMAVRYFGRIGRALAVLIALAVPADLIEGVIQIALLNGYNGLINVKAVLTPVKFALAYFGIAIALLGGLVAAYRALFRRNAG